MLMQIYADISGCTMQVAGSSQTCALGSAISASVLAGAHKDFQSAQKAMVKIKPKAYVPNPVSKKTYDELFSLYRALHDAFGGVNRKADLSGVMKELLAISKRSLARS